MRVLAVALIVSGVLAIGTAAPALAQDGAPAARHLELAFDPSGLVTLRASNVPVREVLAEWARQCGCFIVNAQDLTAMIDVPIQFEQAPQAQVLQALLRKAAGYVLSPKRAGSAGPSNYEMIYVLATSNPSAAAYIPSAPVFNPIVPAPVSLATPVVPSPTLGAPGDEIPPITPALDPSMPPPGTTQPTQPSPRLPGTPGRFVPIVPIGPGSSTPSNRVAPGSVTPAPPTTAPQTTPNRD